MNIGNLHLNPGVGLAPMAGVTDMPFRLICREMGASFAVTEMLSAKGYMYAAQARPTLDLIARDPREGILGLQLFGHEPDVMAETAARLCESFDFIDINMGCPAPKIVSGGDGSALMKSPALAGKIIEAVVKRVPCPVTVKMRAGWDDEHKNALELCRIAQESGAAAVTVHARTRAQFYAGRADWSIIGEAASLLDIPVIGNGDVFTAADGLNLLASTGCAGIMVGRGAQGNPWLFRDISLALDGKRCPPPNFQDRARMAIRHLKAEAAFRGEKSAVLEMRKHIPWYLSGYPGCAKIRAHINTLTSLDEVLRALEALIQ